MDKGRPEEKWMMEMIRMRGKEKGKSLEEEKINWGTKELKK